MIDTKIKERIVVKLLYQKGTHILNTGLKKKTKSLLNRSLGRYGDTASGAIYSGKQGRWDA